MCAPNGANFDTKDEKEKMIRVREIDQGRYKINFISKPRTGPKPNNEEVSASASKSQAKEISDNNDVASAWSTKDGTSKDVTRTVRKDSTQELNLNTSYKPKGHICDDWDFLEDNYCEIKAIWIYASYYIKAIKVVYETNDMNILTTVHSAKNFDPETEAKLSYREFELEEGEYIERIHWVKSSQTGLIRSISIGTNFERNMWVEGEIEVHDIFQLEPERRARLEDEDTQRLIGPDSHSVAEELENSQSNMFLSQLRDSIKKKSIVFEGDNEIYDLDKLNIRKQSVIDWEDKFHSCNLKFINHILVGFKTKFNEEYLEDIELYTEQNEDIKINMIENSPGKARFLFV